MVVKVNGLILPSEMIAAIVDGRWQPPADLSTYLDVFGDEPVAPEFYDLDAIERENRSWSSVSVEDFLCEPMGDGNLGLSLELSVLIASLGPDMPVVLDYRLSRERPCVLYLGGDDVPRWSRVASSFDQLLTLLKL